jgi:hypothetical protein
MVGKIAIRVQLSAFSKNEKKQFTLEAERSLLIAVW